MVLSEISHPPGPHSGVIMRAPVRGPGGRREPAVAHSVQFYGVAAVMHCFDI